MVSAITVLLYPGLDRWGLFEIEAGLEIVVREDMSPQDQQEAATQMGQLETSSHEFR